MIKSHVIVLLYQIAIYDQLIQPFPVHSSLLCMILLVYILISRRRIVVLAVIEVPTSTHLTTVPFKALLTELTASVEVRGELPSADVLIKVIIVEFTIISDS